MPERCWNVSKKNIRTTYNIEGMPEDEKNVPFYEKHGFQRMEHGAAIQFATILINAKNQKETQL